VFLVELESQVVVFTLHLGQSFIELFDFIRLPVSLMVIVNISKLYFFLILALCLASYKVIKSNLGFFNFLPPCYKNRFCYLMHFKILVCHVSVELLNFLIVQNFKFWNRKNELIFKPCGAWNWISVNWNLSEFIIDSKICQHFKWLLRIENLVVEQSYYLQTCQTFQRIDYRNLIPIQE